ncbi:MAG: DUF4364 family protein [Oscillospiraceae bacterium]|nr:DUF4364 family protein [Oscillospiraceae bacterium]
MNFNAFVGGIEPGGLTNDFEVKILICFLLKKIEQPLSCEQINESLQKTGFVNYFEFVEAISELQKTEHIQLQVDENGQEQFALTEIGDAMAQAFHHTLPLSVRDKTVEAAHELLQLQKQLEEIEVAYHAVSDGYMLTMKMKDIGSSLMELSVYVPTEDECISIRQRIYEDPLLLYRTLLSVMLGQYQEGKELFEEKLK